MNTNGHVISTQGLSKSFGKVHALKAQVNYPDLLILDEPAANLDPQGRRDVLEVAIQRFNRQEF